MATKQQKTTKRIKNRVKQIVESNIFSSIAVASVLLNVLFLASIFVLSGTDSFNRQFYTSAHSKYCSNVDGVIERAKQLGDDSKALKEWQITCVTKEFKPFYDEAVEKFNAQYPN